MGSKSCINGLKASSSDAAVYCAESIAFPVNQEASPQGILRFADSSVGWQQDGKNIQKALQHIELNMSTVKIRC